MYPRECTPTSRMRFGRGQDAVGPARVHAVAHDFTHSYFVAGVLHDSCTEVVGFEEGDPDVEGVFVEGAGDAAVGFADMCRSERWILNAAYFDDVPV